jgi:hypothetical protein
MPLCIGLGVVPGSNIRFLAGVIGTVFACAEVSDSGGDGGDVCTVLVSLFGGGVAIVGLEMVVADVEASDEGVGGLKLSVASAEGFLLAWSCSIVSSANRSFSCVISASTFRSLNSSRRRCASTRRFSRSCSPFLISSSSMTPLSIMTLYLDSMSSRDEF